MDTNQFGQHEAREAQNQPPASDVIGYEEAAQLLNIAVGTLYAWTSQRRIEFYRIGPRCVKFSRSKLLAWLERQTVTIADPARQ